MYIDRSAGGSHEGDMRVAGHFILGGASALAAHYHQLRFQSDDHCIAQALKPLDTPEVGRCVVGDGGSGGRGERGRLCDDPAFRYAVGVHVVAIRVCGAVPQFRPFGTARRAEPSTFRWAATPPPPNLARRLDDFLLNSFDWRSDGSIQHCCLQPSSAGGIRLHGEGHDELHARTLGQLWRRRRPGGLRARGRRRWCLRRRRARWRRRRCRRRRHGWRQRGYRWHGRRRWCRWRRRHGLVDSRSDWVVQHGNTQSGGGGFG